MTDQGEFHGPFFRSSHIIHPLWYLPVSLRLRLSKPVMCWFSVKTQFKHSHPYALISLNFIHIVIACREYLCNVTVHFKQLNVRMPSHVSLAAQIKLSREKNSHITGTTQGPLAKDDMPSPDDRWFCNHVQTHLTDRSDVDYHMTRMWCINQIVQQHRDTPRMCLRHAPVHTCHIWTAHCSSQV